MLQSSDNSFLKSSSPASNPNAYNPIKTVTAPDSPVPFAAVLEAHYTPSAAQVISAVHSLFGTGS